MGKLALSAAWPETRTAPGTVLSAQDTFLPPRGRSLQSLNTPFFNLYLPSEGLLSVHAAFQQHPALVSSHAVTPGTYQYTCILLF